MKYSASYLQDLQAEDYRDNLSLYSGLSVLITGATGLIGSCLADIFLSAIEKDDLAISLGLAGRNEKACRDRFAYWQNDEWVFESYDAQKPLSLSRGYDYIFHCASNAHPAAYAAEPVETAMTNVIGMHNILAFARDCNAKRVLYVSSSEVYGKKDAAIPYREDEYLFVDPLDPRSCYPNSKRLAETLCAAYEKEYGVQSVIVRPGHIFGPTSKESDSRAHAQFARCAAAGKDIVMKSAGEQLRSYCYMMDCCSAMLAVMRNGKSGEAYNISNPQSVVTIRELAEAFAANCGVGLRFENPSDAEKSGYNRMSCSALNSEKLEALGWKGLFDLEKGVQRTIDAL